MAAASPYYHGRAREHARITKVRDSDNLRALVARYTERRQPDGEVHPAARRRRRFVRQFGPWTCLPELGRNLAQSHFGCTTRVHK